MSLTPKQELFCQHYLLDMNATQAAIRAGYSAATANEQGARLLANVSIATRVHGLVQTRAERLQVDADWVLRQLVTVAERCSAPRPKLMMTMAGLQQVKTPEGEGVYEFDAIGANKALELIGKHIGFFDKHNQQKQAKVTITIGGKAIPVPSSPVCASPHG